MELKTKRRQEVNGQENDEGISRQVDQKLILLQSSAAGLMSTSDGFHREALQSKSLTFGESTRALGIFPYPDGILTYISTLDVGVRRKRLWAREG